MILVMLMASVSSAQTETELKDHIFFLGLDVSVLQPEGFLPVEGFHRGNVTVSIDGTNRTVKLGKLEDVDSKIQPKISSGSIVLSEVRGYRTFTPKNDPTFKAVRTQSRMMADEMSMEAEYNQALSTEFEASGKIQNILATSTDPGIAQQARIAGANIEMRTLQASRNMEGAGSLNSVADAPGDDASGSDAYTVTCSISSEEPIKNGYAVLVTNVLFPEAATSIRALSFEQLSGISTEPRKVRFTQEWLPVGYKIESYEIHTYREDGSEIATNLSGKRAELSRSEAFQFLLFQYVSSNKFENLPARLVRELLPADFSLFVPQAQLDRSVHLDIDENGTVSNVQLEKATKDDADAFLTKALANLYFYPALAYGEPIESTLTLTLAQMVN